MVEAKHMRNEAVRVFHEREIERETEICSLRRINDDLSLDL
jgi:hypothetical protein